MYVWQWGRAQRTEGRATVLCSCAAAEEHATKDAGNALVEQAIAHESTKRRPTKSSACAILRKQRQKESSQAPGWQPPVARGNQGRTTVRYADGTTADVRNGRITRVANATVAAPMVIITPDTCIWRRLARSQLDVTEDALDIGCSLGVGTAVIAEHCRSVVGIDVSRDILEHARAAVPTAQFECFDVLRHPERLASVAAGRTVVFADIGGNRELEALAALLPRLQALPSVRLIVVKSKSLYKSALEWSDGQAGARTAGPKPHSQPQPQQRQEPEPEGVASGTVVKSEQEAAVAARQARLAQLHSADSDTIGAVVPDCAGFISSLSWLARHRLDRQSRSRQARAERVKLRGANSKTMSPERAHAKALAQEIISRVLVGAVW